MSAKPFLKWAGGKSHLIKQYVALLPQELFEGKIEIYVEPFIGSGALYFYLSQRFNFKKVYLYDVNKELILAYSVIKNNVEKLIEVLHKYTKDYRLLDDAHKSTYYYCIREKFNTELKTIDFTTYSTDWIIRTAELIFLNKTCYNGLFRVNKKGVFNVPFGRYKNPTIFDAENLEKTSTQLKKANIEACDFKMCKSHIDKKTLVYLDPPYRPISNTANFTSYSHVKFNDNEQKRLAKFYTNMNKTGAKLMLSNSDPRTHNPNDNFFDDLYKEFNIHRVYASRIISCDASKRGTITELLITNY